MDSANDSINETSDDNQELELHHLRPDNRERIVPTRRNIQDRQLSASVPVPSNVDSDLVQLQKRLHHGSNVRPFEVKMLLSQIFFANT